MKRNFWDVFLDKYFPNRENLNVNRRQWENLIDNTPKQKYALRLLAIAYLTSLTDKDVTYNTLIADYPTYYNSLGQHPKELSEQLKFLGVELLTAENGSKQYLRTILKYSGNMYIRIARVIAANVYTWEIERLNKYLEIFKERFSASDRDEDKAVEDAANFFRLICERYRLTNLPPSVEDVRECSSDLTDAVVKKVYEILFGNNKNDNLETRPVIDIDANGNAIFKLPEKGVFPEEISRAVFVFRNGNTDLAVFDYENSKSWKKNKIKGPSVISVHKVSVIKLYWWKKDENCRYEEDVMPEVCFQDFFLIDKNNHPVDKVSVGSEYKLIQLRGNTARISYWTYDDEEKFINFQPNAFFCIPSGTTKFMIGDEEIPLRNSYSEWIERKNEYCFSRGCRLFLPVSEEENIFNGNADSKDVYIKYGDQIIYSCENEWNSPPKWEQKSIEVFYKNECVLKHPVTFIDSILIDGETVQNFAPISFGEEKNLKITIEDQNFCVSLGKNELKVPVKYKNFELSIRIPRRGVYLELPEKNIIPLLPQKPHTDSQIAELSLDDFNRGVCHVVNCCIGQPVLFARGNNTDAIECGGKKSISFKLKRKMQSNVPQSEQRSKFCSIFISPKEIFRFKIYNPLKKKLPSKNSSVTWERSQDDLLITYHTSRLNSVGDKYIVFYPAHLQDHPHQESEAGNVELFSNKQFGFVQRVTFKDFFTKDIVWGEGLLAFVATKEKYCGGQERNRVITSGFFLPAPEGKDRSIDDDPYGLRAAMAKCDVPNICSIMRDSNTDVREYVATFITNMTRCMAELDINVFNYLNSYWNILFPATSENLKDPTKQSGYIFQAGWFFVNGPGRAVEKNELNDDYRPYWNYFLFAQEYWDDTQLDTITTGMLDGIYSTICSALTRNNEFSIKQKKIFIDLVDPNNVSADDNDVIFLSEKIVFTYPQLSEIVRKALSTNHEPTLKNLKSEGWAKGLLSLWKEYFTNKALTSLEKITSANGEGLQSVRETQPWNNCETIVKFITQSYLYYTGYQYDRDMKKWSYSGTITKRVSVTQLKNFLDGTADELANWRQNPTLEGAQKLREVLVALRNIDDWINYNSKNACPLCFYVHVKALMIAKNNNKGE